MHVPAGDGLVSLTSLKIEARSLAAFQGLRFHDLLRANNWESLDLISPGEQGSCDLDLDVADQLQMDWPFYDTSKSHTQ
jgi:hypothetical protein